MNSIFNREEIDFLLLMTREYINTSCHSDKLTLKRIEKKLNTIPIICGVDDCNSNTYKNGYCKDHYEYYSKYESTIKEIKIEKSKICTVSGCYEKMHAKGYCAKHYEYFKRHGDGKND